MATRAPVTARELTEHSSQDNCWLLINGIVWDFTDFASQHPGGANIIYKYAGCDATSVYNTIHAPSLVQRELGASKCIGEIETASLPTMAETPEIQIQTHAVGVLTGATAAVATTDIVSRRPLETLLNSQDFEQAASEILSEKAWAFFSSAATDCLTKEANTQFFGRIWLRPRILRNVSSVNLETTMLGNKIGFPLFASPVAMGKLAHPHAELAVARGCAKFKIAQTISTNASYPVGDITEAAKTTFFFQLYINKDRSVSEKLLREAERCGCKAVFVTVDQPTPGKREADERAKNDAISSAGSPNTDAKKSDKRGSGLSRLMAGFIDSTVTWKDIAWMRRATRLPIVLKGVQTAADAILAAEHGIDGIVIGNHGGRSLDTSTPAIIVLLELQRTCPGIFKNIEVFVDGGVRRGTDIFKALCLGAKAVGMGRSILYASTYGEEGVEQLIEIMKEEFETTMRMMGCTDVSQLHPGLLNLCDVEHLVPQMIEGQQQSWKPLARL